MPENVTGFQPTGRRSRGDRPDATRVRVETPVGRNWNQRTAAAGLVLSRIDELSHQAIENESEYEIDTAKSFVFCQLISI
jgi:hypothetical protein